MTKTKMILTVKPAGECGFLYLGDVNDPLTWVNASEFLIPEIKEGVAAWELVVKPMTQEELDALPEFDGW